MTCTRSGRWLTNEHSGASARASTEQRTRGRCSRARVDRAAMAQRVAPFKPSNAAMFNRDGRGPALYNGMGTTKTRPSPTLFVTNLPAAVTSAELEQVFQFDPGFQRIRTVRRMVSPFGLSLSAPD